MSLWLSLFLIWKIRILVHEGTRVFRNNRWINYLLLTLPILWCVLTEIAFHFKILSQVLILIIFLNQNILIKYTIKKISRFFIIINIPCLIMIPIYLIEYLIFPFVIIHHYLCVLKINKFILFWRDEHYRLLYSFYSLILFKLKNVDIDSFLYGHFHKN